MEVSPRPRRRGAGLVFILLAVIAMLAIAIVLLSHLTHRDSAGGKDSSLSNGMMDIQTHSDMETTSTDTATNDAPGSSSPEAIEEDNAVTPALAFPPPPPAAIATPDSAHLPPEG